MIRLLLVDVDGTLTDGLYRVSEDGAVSKSFFTRDFHGLWMLNKQRVTIAVITAASDKIIDMQCKRAGGHYIRICKGVKDKSKFVAEDSKFQSYDWSEMAFIGDDLFDAPLLKRVGLAGCPADADPQIIKLVADHPDGFVSDFPAGRGAVRDFADYIREGGIAR